MSIVFAHIKVWHLRTAAILAVLLLSGLGMTARAEGSADQQSTIEELIQHAARPTATEASSWSVVLDNDLFGPEGTDRDYTGGFAVSLRGAGAARYWWSLDRLLRLIDAPLFAGNARWRNVSPLHGLQAGFVIFTPQDLASSAVVEGDRPYASLLFLSSARDYVAADEGRSRYSGLTLGILGLRATTDVQTAVHRVMGDVEPRGFGNQISAGGELTARFLTGGSQLRAQRLLGDKSAELKTTWEMSAGYLTEASYAVSARFGLIDSPWWTFNPERTDYIAQPAPVDAPTAGGRGELYVWAGAKVRLRAYNAFLQGQFRDSTYTLGADDISPLIGEAWIGLTTRLSSATQISYVLRYQTAEVHTAAGRRSPIWGGLTLSHAF